MVRVGSAEVVKTPANVMAEITVEAKVEHKDSFNEVTLNAVFTDPSGAMLRVPAFWSGGRAWKGRYASPVGGSHGFKMDCSDVNDAGLNAVVGVVEVREYKGGNPLDV